jgi:hypothetical protein
MNYYSKEEKVKHIVKLTKLLRNFPTTTGRTMDIYNDEYSFVEKFKTISMHWVNNDYSNYKGRLYFEEINKFIEYDLPKTKDKTPKLQLCKNTYKI